MSATADPARKSASGWSSGLANLKSRRIPDSDPRVAEARAGLSYHRCRRVIDAELTQLSNAGIDRLVATLRQGAAR